MIKAGVLALQGAFLEHEKALASLGVESVELRQKSDLLKSFDFLVLPGGESTVQGKLLHELGMFEPLEKCIKSGSGVFATCAGMILLAEKISNDDRRYFSTMPITVTRNAYGRQLGSFHTEADFEGVGKIPMTFIRAPAVEKIGEGCRPLAECGGKVVAVSYKKQLALAFHPELDGDLRVYEYFLSQVIGSKKF